jgi:hypothetical protein
LSKEISSHLTERQAQIIAAAWHELRPRWGVPALLTLLAKNQTRAPFGDLLRAGINAALDPRVETPGAIFVDGPHWLTVERAALKAAESAAQAAVAAVVRSASAPAPPRWVGNDTSEDCPNHPTVKAWDCRPCRRADPPPPNLRERIAAEAEKVRAARAAKLQTPTTAKEEAPSEDSQEPQSAPA